jgi:hypothetical protein
MEKKSIPNGQELFIDERNVVDQPSDSDDRQLRWRYELPSAKVAGARDRQQKKDQ